MTELSQGRYADRRRRSRRWWPRRRDRDAQQPLPVGVGQEFPSVPAWPGLPATLPVELPPAGPVRSPGTANTPGYPGGAPAVPATVPVPGGNAAGGAARGQTVGYNQGHPGSCVQYVLDRFHRLTGVYPRTFGDAWTMANGAATSGWSVGAAPRVNSIAIFQPGQNGAGQGTGHAAWVEQVPGDGRIMVSEMNAPDPFIVTTRTLTPHSGVRYIYAA